MRAPRIAFLCLALVATARFASAEPPAIAPEVGGFLIVLTAPPTSGDPRPGRIAAGFAARGYESFVAAEMVQPPPDAEKALVRARWRLDDARRMRRRARVEPAAQAADEAIRILQTNAFEGPHLELLVVALVERGASAVQMEDPATAETMFLRALAIDPNYELDPVLFEDRSRNLFAEVRRAARQLRYGSVRVEAPWVPGASVRIDFGAPKDPPAEAKLADGRHFITVSAPGRHEVVTFVPVRAERQTALVIRPPLAGDVDGRAAALAASSLDAPATVVELTRTAGLRFSIATELGRSNVTLTLYDGRTGQPVSGGVATLSVDPGADEIGAAVEQMVQSGLQVEPGLAPEEEGGFFTSWWGITILGVAVAGAAAGTAFALTRGGTTEYRFVP